MRIRTIYSSEDRGACITIAVALFYKVNYAVRPRRQEQFSCIIGVSYTNKTSYIDQVVEVTPVSVCVLYKHGVTQGPIRLWALRVSSKIKPKSVRS